MTEYGSSHLTHVQQGRRIARNFQPVLQSDTLSQQEMKANELQLVQKIFTIAPPKHELSEVDI